MNQSEKSEFARETVITLTCLERITQRIREKDYDDGQTHEDLLHIQVDIRAKAQHQLITLGHDPETLIHMAETEELSEKIASAFE